MLRFVTWLLLSAMALLLCAGFVLIVTVLARENRVHDLPLPPLRASTSPEAIERGRYLVNGPAHCISCHDDPDAPGEPALSGGLAFHIPLGTYFAPNITSDPETGIGEVSDGALARTLRHGVDRDGRVLVPFMAFADLSDEDVVAIISYLRTLPPVRHEVPGRSLTPLGRLVHALVLSPEGPTQPPRATIPAGPTVAYGEYLATHVANCVGCHTRRGDDGSFAGPRFAGGFEMHTPGGTFVTPNLTPHPQGRLTGWTEADFVARFRAGGNPASPMPWGSFSKMTDDDLRALFRFLRSLEPAL
jgi:mono/diheme cytochrome c family protein